MSETPNTHKPHSESGDKILLAVAATSLAFLAAGGAVLWHGLTRSTRRWV